MPEITEEALSKYKADSERATNLEASKKRLEDENSKIKTRAKDAEEKLSDAEKKTLESQGKTQELLDKERNDNVSLKTKLADSRKIALKEKLRTEASLYAKDAHDIDMVLRVTKHKDILKIDEEAGTVTGIKDYIEKVRETDSYLFGEKRLDDIENKKPKGGSGDGDKTEDQKYLAELKDCTTRKDMDAIRKKYGRPVKAY